MKLTITANRPPNGTSFQAADRVEGRVQLDASEGTDVSEIRVIFQGTAKMTLKPGFDARNQVGDTRRRRCVRLFCTTQVVKPTLDDDDDDDDDDNDDNGNDPQTVSLSAPFAFAFPKCARCCSGCCALPPSTAVSTPALRIRVSYSVTAVCRRPGGRLSKLLHRTMAASQLLAYRPPVGEQLLGGPSPSPLLLPSPPPAVDACPETQRQLVRGTAWLPASDLGVDAGGGGGDKAAAAALPLPGVLPPDCLPAYSPAMALEVVLPHPPAITPGAPVALGLFLRTPRGMLDAAARAKSSLRLCSLSVRLRRHTQAGSGPAVRVDDAVWPLWSVHGRIPVRQERLDLGGGSGSGGDGAAANVDGRGRLLLRVPPAAAMAGQPGFWTCFASRVYSIEVSMGVAVVAARARSASAPDVHCATTSVRVMVSDPPPDYESGDVIGGE